jgi:hypothetical protein
LLQLFGGKLNEDAAFERLGVTAAQANCIGRSVRRKEGFNIELSAWQLFTETFSIDTARHCSVLKHFDYLFDRSVVQAFRKRLNSLNASVIIGEPENSGVFHGRDNSFEGLEVTHALEGVNDFEFNRMILAAADFGEEELVHGEI